MGDRYANTARATRRFPIEVRYSDTAHTEWTLYSRHSSRRAADRAYAEVCREMPDRWVQMRNDIDRVGILCSRYVRRADDAPPAPVGKGE